MANRNKEKTKKSFYRKLARICKQSYRYGFVLIAIILPLLLVNAYYYAAPEMPADNVQTADEHVSEKSAEHVQTADEHVSDEPQPTSFPPEQTLSLTDVQTPPQVTEDDPQPSDETAPAPPPPESAALSASAGPNDNDDPAMEEMADQPHEESGGGQPDAMPTPEAPEAPEQPAEKKVAYITIDDGPSRSVTPGILDLLKEEGIKATFFVLPHNGVDDLYQRIVDEGHELGNHTYSHSYSKLYRSNDLDSFTEDVLAAREFVYDNFGYYTVSFRFPGGAMSHSSAIIGPRREILEQLGYKDYDWNIDTGDSNANVVDKSAANLVGNVLRYTRGRKQIVVLMHDIGGKRTTLQALPTIIKGLREQGYSFDILRHYDNFNKTARKHIILSES